MSKGVVRGGGVGAEWGGARAHNVASVLCTAPLRAGDTVLARPAVRVILPEENAVETESVW